MSVESNPTDYSRVSSQVSGWGRNTTLDALKAAAKTYNASDVAYSDSSVYYNGYNPGSHTPDGSKTTDFSRVGQSTAGWTNPEEDEQ